MKLSDIFLFYNKKMLKKKYAKENKKFYARNERFPFLGFFF